MSTPRVATVRVSADAARNGRITPTCTTRPNTPVTAAAPTIDGHCRPTPRVTQPEEQEATDHRERALREVDDPRAAVHDDDALREQHVDRAGAEREHAELQNLGHGLVPVLVGASRGRRSDTTPRSRRRDRAGRHWFPASLPGLVASRRRGRQPRARAGCVARRGGHPDPRRPPPARTATSVRRRAVRDRATARRRAAMLVSAPAPARVSASVAHRPRGARREPSVALSVPGIAPALRTASTRPTRRFSRVDKPHEHGTSFGDHRHTRTGALVEPRPLRRRRRRTLRRSSVPARR